MAGQPLQPKEIVAELRQVGEILAYGKSAVEAVRPIGVTERTSYRRRSAYEA